MSKEVIPNEIKAMGVTKAKDTVQLLSYKTKPLGKYDADIRVTYNGVCHSDIHMIDNDWGMSRYPLIPGHEIVGHVLNIGKEVSNVQVGDVVTLGVICQSCMKCTYCITGYDNLCSKREFTYFGNPIDETGCHPHHGGFSSFIRTDSRKLLHVPKGLEEKYVGPLMCAGITVYEPLSHFLKGKRSIQQQEGGGVGGKMTIGILGIGGLGHMAIQFASKMSGVDDVIAFSRGLSKESFAKDLGATKFVDTTNVEAMNEMKGTLDQLIVTIAGTNLDMDNVIFPLMKYEGNVHLCGIPSEKVQFEPKTLIFRHLSITGNPVGGGKDTKEMLHFAVTNSISPIIEVFSHSDAANAIQKIRDGTIRFRAVLKNDLV